MRALLIASLLLSAGCSNKRELEPAPEWATERGKARARLEIASDLIDHGATQQALLVLNTMRGEGHQSPELDLLHGRALYKEGLLSEAERMLLIAVEQMPRDARPHESLGVLYADLERVDDAIVHLQRALGITPDKAATWNNLGFLLLSQKRHDEALEALQRAVALDGTIGRYRNNLGFALVATGHTADALRTFQSTGSRADAHANVGLGLELAGRNPEAVAQYGKALALDPSHAPASQGMSRIDSSSEDR